MTWQIGRGVRLTAWFGAAMASACVESEDDAPEAGEAEQAVVIGNIYQNLLSVPAGGTGSPLTVTSWPAMSCSTPLASQKKW